MKILGIDTTTKFFCLGVSNGNKIYGYNLEVGRQLSSMLSVTIKRVLDAAGLRIKDIDYFACGLGPGSFTGVRTGLSAIKGMSWALKKPIIGISTLDILAQEIRHSDELIVPVIDARRSLIYCAVFKNKNGRLLKLSPYMLLAQEEFFKKIKGNAIVLGDAVGLYRDKILANIRGAVLLDKDYWYPKAHNIITLALARIKAKKLDSPFKLKPIYLYPKECQIRNSKF